MICEEDVFIIQKWIDKYLIEPDFTDRYAFDQYSYSKFAAEELMNFTINEFDRQLLSNDYDLDFIELINIFAFDMERYAEIAQDWSVKKIFCISKETADDILWFYIDERKKSEIDKMSKIL